MRRRLMLSIALLLTGVDLRAQDITDLPDTSLEGVGVTCIALAVFADARHASYLEQVLVARTVLNRQAEIGPEADACDVVQAPGFSPALDAWPYPREPWRIDARAWQQALDVARTAIAGDFDVPRACAGATRFSSAPANPARSQACTVGALVFSSGQRP